MPIMVGARCVGAGDDAFAASNPWGGATYKGVRIDEEEAPAAAAPWPASGGGDGCTGAAAAAGDGGAAAHQRVSRFDQPPPDLAASTACDVPASDASGVKSEASAPVSNDEAGATCGGVDVSCAPEAVAEAEAAPAVTFKRRNMGGGDARKRRRTDDD